MSTLVCVRVGVCVHAQHAILSSLSTQLRHEVVVFHLLDADEVNFPFTSLTNFRDLETTGQLMTDPLRIRKTYLDRVEKFREAIKSGCASAGAEYRFIDTSEPLETVLRDYLLFRRQRSR